MLSRSQGAAMRAPTIGLAGVGLVGGFGSGALAQDVPAAAAQLPEMNVQGSAPVPPYQAGDNIALPHSPFSAGQHRPAHRHG